MLTAYRDGDTWMVRSPDHRKLFGTDSIPSAYLTTTPAKEVFQELVKLNPDKRVRVLDIYGNEFYRN